MSALDVFILAGGRSSRMGTNKALLDLGGRTLLARVLDAARPVAGALGALTLIANDAATYAGFGVAIVPDRFPGAAALGGIATALHHARTQRALVLACDLPFLSPAFLSWIVDLDPEAEVTLPATAAEGIHPLCAVYSRSCLPPIERRIAARELKVAGFFPEVRVRRVEESEIRAAGFAPEILANLNTPEELARVR